MNRIFGGRGHGGVALRLIDLGQPLGPGIPHSPSHPGYKHALLRRHGDAVRVDGTSGANDLLVLGTHTGTHVDALAHISHDGMLHGGIDAERAQRGGRFASHGVEHVEPTIAPGFLFDVPRLRGVERLDPGRPVTVAELEAIAAEFDADIPPGAALLIRTGWAQHWAAPDDFLSHDAGVPGPDEDACGWLAAREPRVVGSDTTAFEWIPPGKGHARLPGHRVLLVENGVPIIEMLNLEAIAAESIPLFDFYFSPLALLGATGSPVRPLAVVVDTTVNRTGLSS